MKSFRTEIENPVVEHDIIELERKIRLFREGEIDEERFRSLRLARGVYGQRQPGVQMIRIKLPFGKVTSEQLNCIADVSDRYSNGNLHITTRQDIQIHHVLLDQTPQLWAELEECEVTLREACGNTVRNVTASPEAGIDPAELFDVSPYADAVFRFFLRNPVCQEMGRKFKIAFSATDVDTALTYIHDLGFIPRIRDNQRGFKVMLGGGLGSQPREADTVSEFLEADKLIPFIESVLRVFDRHGERAKRLKARMKFLIRDIGLPAFLELVEQERLALSAPEFRVDTTTFEVDLPAIKSGSSATEVEETEDYRAWLKHHVFEQKQKGYFAVGIKVHLGNFSTAVARELAAILKEHAGNELRFTLRQDILIRHVPLHELPVLYEKLKDLGLTEAGYESTSDITACPGTDTCNLGIASSTGIARELEGLLREEYPQHLHNKDLTIKISGCMNACGQHNMAHIGFQGMSLRAPDRRVAPALQVLLGGGVTGGGKGRFADKVIKIPSKRGPEALRTLLDDFDREKINGEDFTAYYDRRGKGYFYDLLKALSDTDALTEDDFVDWGHEKKYVQAVGIGECAGVVIDLVATLLFESEEKLDNARKALADEQWADAVYYAYSALVITAKALLTAEGEKTNTHAGIITGFDEVFNAGGSFTSGKSFSELVFAIRENEPDKAFAESYLSQAADFYLKADAFRKKQLQHDR